MKTTSVIELSQKALQNNIDFLKDYFNGEVRFSSVVKGNAYGHGIEEYVPMAEICGVDHFSVFSADEAYRVFKCKSANTDIMIMGWVDDEDLEWAISNRVAFYVFEMDRLNAALNIARKLQVPAKLHVEVETGMNRTGFKQKTLPEVAATLKKNQDYLIFQGLCTHFAGAESIANHVRVNRQFSKFKKIYNWFLKNDLKPRMKHSASSAAAMTYPRTRMDLVRIGILQYGFWPSMETYIHFISKRVEKMDPLRRVISWKSKVMTIKDVNQGEFVSYGTTYLASENKTIAVIPVGYAHGFSRSLSNSGTVLIHGQRVSVIGMVNMNMLITDISFLPDVQVGDEVVLIGKQGNHTISVSSFTQMSDQLNYELLTRLPSNTTRIVTS
ncbi:MAG: alanine racemase [Bacteroidota bacterium]|nr:alanine racemase [Bacteroidota bacterium]